MDEAVSQAKKIEDQVIERSGIVFPIFLTLFVITITLGLVLLPTFGAREPLLGLLEAPEWWTENIGEYHPLILHLPIGIVFLTMVMEVCRWLSFGRYRPMTGVGLFLAFVTGAFACLTGFFDMKVSGMKAESWDDAWFQHMWMGIIFVGVLGFAFLAKIWGERRGARGPMYGILLFGAAGIMGYGSHIGGMKVHKTDPVANTLEGLKLLNSNEEIPEAEDLPELSAVKAPKDLLAFAEVVLPIMDTKCLYCHSEEAGKSRGGLYMDTYENLLIGGDSQDDDEFRTLVPGDAEKSYMIEVMVLPMDDDMHMPPPKKEQMAAHEIELLTWWVENIPASDTLEDKTLGEMGAPQNILDAAAKMVSPEELEAMEKELADEKAKVEAAKVAKREALGASLSELKADELLSTAIDYTSQDSSDLEFSAVSLRERMDDGILAKLSPVAEALTSLRLGSTSVTEFAVVEQLSQMPNLVKLDLSQTEVGDGAMKAISKLENLEYLNLYGTQVSDVGLLELKTLVNLRKLYLWQSRATPEGAEELKKELPGVEIVFGID